MSSVLPLHTSPPSVSSGETPITEHDDVSVAASDDVDVTATSTATDPSVTEHDTGVDEKSLSSKNPSPTASRGPVMLLRRQPTSTSSSSSRQATPIQDVRQPSPTRVENTMPTPTKETLDPSLLEAFANPMNRQYLLQLEESLNNFVNQTRTDTMELPPTNSFFRCLAHKMADHYRLQHVADSGHVVLFRSPYARIPETRLSELSKTIRTSNSSGSSTGLSEDGLPSSTPEIKQIMKRVAGKQKDGEDDSKSESSQSQVLSHDERKAVYDKARARIFSDYVQSQGVEPPEKESDAGSETSSMRREKSLLRSDSFQTRQQFARESAVCASYAAALAGNAPGPVYYQGYPPQVAYPPQQGNPYGYPANPTANQYQTLSSPAPQPPRIPSRPESRTSSPATRDDSPGFQPSPFAREFVPAAASGGGSGLRAQPRTPPVSNPVISSTPPRPPENPPIYDPSASSTYSNPSPRPSYPSPYPQFPIPSVPCAPPQLQTPRQIDYGPPVSTGTVRFIANGQLIPAQVLPYRAHPMPPMNTYVYPPPLLRNGHPQQLEGISTAGEEDTEKSTR